jgi:hypothetical protein
MEVECGRELGKPVSGVNRKLHRFLQGEYEFTHW